jgi:hypothetical protein
MVKTRERMERLRQKRRAEGERAVEVWLDPLSDARFARLRQPSESVSAVIRRALAALDAREANGRQSVTSDTSVEAALVGLVQALFPVDTPVYPRHTYGISALPLYAINTVLDPYGLVLKATKTRLAKHFVQCTDKDGGVERFGLFELRRVEEDLR